MSTSNPNMKHIKRKFLFEKSLNDQQLADMRKRGMPVDRESRKNTKIPKEYSPLLLTDDNRAIQAFQMKLNGNTYYVPEPDPILIYFNNAYANYVRISETKKDVQSVLGEDHIASEQARNLLYRHFGRCSGFVIFLFTAIEGFINKHIPENYTFALPEKKRTEVYNKIQIERYLSFDVKYSRVLPDIKEKDFKTAHPLKQQHITNLKEFRDALIHTKTESTGMTPYDHLFKKSFNFNYVDTLMAVRDMMNFYESDYIENCLCNDPW